EMKYGKSIPTWSGDFTPYWEDGAYSTAAEEGKVRVLSARLSNLIDAAKILGKTIDPHLLYRAKRSIVMWHEHTWGSWNSISEPDAPFTVEQWKYKKAFADSAGWYVDAISRSIQPSKQKSTVGEEKQITLDECPNDIRYIGTWTQYDLDPSQDVVVEATTMPRFMRDNGTFHCRPSIYYPPARHKRSLHITLPFNIPNATVRIGISDTCITPEAGQIPGSNKDFFCAQRWIDVSNDSMGVTIVCPQGAIWEVGEMVDERKTVPGRGTNAELYKAWKTEAHSSSTIYLYALNNYWHTNFKADQEGPISFDIYLKMHGPFKLEEARRFGLEMTRPLITWWK
ncbi:MAG TPA: hypothetical protein VKG92_00315, partial [Flavobacteriales bacterium]|nr:hypothetical protein [Flavobacteriales bacterium]